MGGIIRKLGVVSENSSKNKSIKDVIGNKNDTSFSDGSNTPSLIGHLVAAYNHIHDKARVYPRTSDNVPAAFLTVTGSATALTYGSWAEVTGYDSKTLLSDIHFIFILFINPGPPLVTGICIDRGQQDIPELFEKCMYISNKCSGHVYHIIGLNHTVAI